MAANIKFKRTTGTGLPTGLTFAEPAFVLGSAGTTTANQLYVGDNSGGRVWVGAKIENTVTNWTGTEANTLLATQQAIDARITSRITSSGGFTFQGSAGTAQTITPGDTVTFAGGTGISTIGGATDTITFVNTGVLSVNGNTGTVSNIAVTNAAQSFSGLQQFTTGICAAGFTFTGTTMYFNGYGALYSPPVGTETPTDAYISMVGAEANAMPVGGGITLSAYNVNFNATKINLGNADLNGTVVTSIIVQGESAPGATGTVTITPGSNIGVSRSSKTITITNNGVRSFNGLTGAVTGVSSVIAGTGISISPAGGTGNQTITNIGVTGLTGTANQITVSGTTGSITLSLPSAITTPGSLTVTGDLTVNGTTTTVNSTVVQVQDPIIAIGGYTGGTPPTVGDVKDRGIVFQYYSGAGATGFFGHDTSATAFTYVPSATLSSEVVSGTPGKAIFGSLDLYSASGNGTLSFSGSGARTYAMPDHSGTVVVPSDLGTSGYILKANGTTSQPTWINPTASGFTAYAATYASNIVTAEGSGTYYLTMASAVSSLGTGLFVDTAATAITYSTSTGTLTCTAVDALIDGGAY